MKSSLIQKLQNELQRRETVDTECQTDEFFDDAATVELNDDTLVEEPILEIETAKETLKKTNAPRKLIDDIVIYSLSNVRLMCLLKK